MDWQETVVTTLEQHGYRMTAPRRTIIERIARFGRSFTAEELYEAVGSDEVGRATVYRTLDLLLAQRWLARLHPNDGLHAYLITAPHHHRMVCKDCGAVFPFDECDVEGLLNELARRTGFRVEGHWLEAFGLCSQCQPSKSSV
jgi:Fur family transcriptional regulator, ferric uptake regulator